MFILGIYVIIYLYKEMIKILNHKKGSYYIMDSEKLEGDWEELKGKLQERWGRLTDDDMDVIDGQKKVLVGKLMDKYGMSEEAASKAIEHIV